MVVAAGLYRGKLTYPTAAGSETLINEKDGGYSRVSTAPHLLWGGANGFVIKVDFTTPPRAAAHTAAPPTASPPSFSLRPSFCRSPTPVRSQVDMASGEAVWATDDGLLTEDVSNRYYLRNVATTADGDVLATADERLKDQSTVGKLVKFDGEDGSKQWSVTYASVTAMYGLDGDADEETVYVLGEFKGEDIDPFGTGAKLTSKKGGAVIAALDVRGSEGPVGKWAIQCDKGDGNSVKAVGAHLYVTGELSGPTTLGDCSLTGEAGGYLAKLNKADGTCVWAKDVPSGRGATAVSDGASVWAFYSDDKKSKYGEQIIYPKAPLPPAPRPLALPPPVAHCSLVVVGALVRRLRRQVLGGGRGWAVGNLDRRYGQGPLRRRGHHAGGPRPRCLRAERGDLLRRRLHHEPAARACGRRTRRRSRLRLGSE